MFTDSQPIVELEQLQRRYDNLLERLQVLDCFSPDSIAELKIAIGDLLNYLDALDVYVSALYKNSIGV